ncbi:unnamed protein product, partial [Linum tenue]
WKLRGMGISVAEELEGECLSLLLQVGVVPGEILAVSSVPKIGTVTGGIAWGSRLINGFGRSKGFGKMKIDV